MSLSCIYFTTYIEKFRGELGLIAVILEGSSKEYVLTSLFFFGSCYEKPAIKYHLICIPGNLTND